MPFRSIKTLSEQSYSSLDKFKALVDSVTLTLIVYKCLQPPTSRCSRWVYALGYSMWSPPPPTEMLCSVSSLESDVQSGTHLRAAKIFKKRLLSNVWCKQRFWGKVSVYVRFLGRLLCVCAGHICAHITLIHGFIGWGFSEVCEGEERKLARPPAPVSSWDGTINTAGKWQGLRSWLWRNPSLKTDTSKAS